MPEIGTARPRPCAKPATSGRRTLLLARAAGAAAAALTALTALAAPADASWRAMEVTHCSEGVYTRVVAQAEPNPDPSECSMSSSASTSGRLRASSTWTAGSTAPPMQAAAWSSARLFGFIDVRTAAPTLTFAATFAWKANGLAVSAARGAAGRVGFALDVTRPGCSADCVTSGQSIVAAEGAGSEVAPAGERTVTVTLRPPVGQSTLPAGRYSVWQTLAAVGLGWRVPGATASARADVDATGVTVTPG